MTIASPYTAPEKWGEVRIGGVLMPGYVIAVDGLKRPYEWAIQQGLGIGGAASIFRTMKLIESASVVLAIPDEESYQALLKFMPILIPGWPSKVKVKPPAYAIENPMFEWVGLRQAAIKAFDAPKDTSGKLHWVQGLEFVEYSPRQTIVTGPAEPAKIDGPPKPADAFEAALLGALAEFNKP